MFVIASISLKAKMTIYFGVKEFNIKHWGIGIFCLILLSNLYQLAMQSYTCGHTLLIKLFSHLELHITTMTHFYYKKICIAPLNL